MHDRNKMFYDKTLTALKIELSEERYTPKEIVDAEVLKERINALEESRLFLLNGAVADDLFHTPYEATDCSSVKHLPFPVMFFEFMDPLDVSLSDDASRRFLGGFLFGEAEKTSAALRWNKKAASRAGESAPECDSLYTISLIFDDYDAVELNVSKDDIGKICGETQTLPYNTFGGAREFSRSDFRIVADFFRFGVNCVVSV